MCTSFILEETSELVFNPLKYRKEVIHMTQLSKWQDDVHALERRFLTFLTISNRMIDVGVVDEKLTRTRRRIEHAINAARMLPVLHREESAEALAKACALHDTYVEIYTDLRGLVNEYVIDLSAPQTNALHGDF